MNTYTINIEPSIYDRAAQYAEAHNVSVQQLAEQYLASLIALAPTTHEQDKPSCRYKISPKIKALECGFKAPADLSEDYKEEISQYRASRYK